MWKPPKIWDDCFIIGGGPSVLSQCGVPVDDARKIQTRDLPLSTLSDYMKPLHEHHCIGINLAYSIGDWIDICFFGDSSWYLHHRKRLAGWPGIKVGCAPRFANGGRDCGVRYMAKDNKQRKGISTRPGKVAWNQNSGAASISMAVQLGCRRIVLLGFDMDLDDQGTSHWHGAHYEQKGFPTDRRGGECKPLRSPPFKRHLRGFPAIAEDAKALGVTILNASTESKITAFDKVNLREVL